MDQARPQPDFYTRLLGIPAGKRPPNHYELLGLTLFTSNFQWIESAVGRRMEELDQFALHPDAAVRRGMQDLVTQVAQARVCLADLETKRKYDRDLAQSLGLNSETVDLPAPGSRRNVAMVAALAACAVMVLGGVVAAVFVWHERGGQTAQRTGAVNASVAVARTPANHSANVTTQPGDVTSKPIGVTDARQKEINAHVAKARGMCEGGNFESALDLLNQAMGICSSPQLLAEIKKVQDAKLQHDQAAGAQVLAKLLSQAETTLQTIPPDKAALLPAQKDQLTQLRQSLDARAATNAQAAALRDRIDALIAPDPQLSLDFGRGVSMKFRLIPKGEFLMGAPAVKSPGGQQPSNQHKEVIAEPMYVGIYSVTQSQWKAIMGTSPWTKPPAHHNRMQMTGDDYPAMNVTYDDAVDFCRRASAKTGRTVRLPTEAQREYACRAGSTGQFCYGDDPTFEKLGECAWYSGTTQEERYAHPVGLKKPNAFGLYDMHGNVLEYCLDSWPPPAPAPSDPFAVNGKVHYLRGGCWNCNGRQCQSDYQGNNYIVGTYGFRVFVDIIKPDPQWDKLVKELDENDRACARWVSEAKGQLARIPEAKGPPSGMERTRLIAARRAVLAALECSPRNEDALAVKETVDGAWSRFMEVEIEVGQFEAHRISQTVSIRLVLILPGEFTMGSPPGEKGRLANEGPRRKVTISKPFYMAVYSVTGEQWIALMGSDPAKGRSTLNERVYPVTNVRWNDAVEFCRALSKKTGRNFHLPTEAQREYACRAGSTTPYFYGDDPNALKLNDYAWSAAGRYNTFTGIREVGKLKPNDWGLYDMLANVLEWCSDRYADQYDPTDTKDPAGPTEGDNRVLRGEFDGAYTLRCRCALREFMAPDQATKATGFRVVMDLDGSGDGPAAGNSTTKPDKTVPGKPAKDAPEPGTWKIVDPGEPGVKNYAEIHDDGTMTITTYTPVKGKEKAFKPEWASIQVTSGHWSVFNGRIRIKNWDLPLPLQNGRKVSVNGSDLTLTRMLGDTAAGEFKAATVRGTAMKIPGVWTLRVTGGAESIGEITFYDNHTAVNKLSDKFGSKPVNKIESPDARYTFYGWAVNGNNFSILAEGKTVYAFRWPLNRMGNYSASSNDSSVRVLLIGPDALTHHLRP